MLSLIIRPEAAADRNAIHAVNAAAFPTPLESDLVDRLRSAGALAVSVVAERDGGVVGQIAFSPVTIDGRATDGVGLAPVAVTPAQQRTGIGSRLIREGLEACRGAGFGFVVVLGEPKFYGRFGFTTASLAGLANEYGVDEPFMVLELRPGGLAGRRGLVQYHAAFAELA
jgi:putative acetyltransferase